MIKLEETKEEEEKTEEFIDKSFGLERYISTHM